MAKMYQIPPNTGEEEKAIGGILTFVQFFWILGGFILFLVSTAFWFVLLKDAIMSGIISSPLLITGLPFAFYKKKDLTLFQYIKRKREFNKKSKKLINKKNVL